jgi:hypothetical protein
MKIYLLSLAICLLTQLGMRAQNDTTTSLDLLRAPSSPGANLLGFATSDIEKSSDVSAFMASLQTASSGFTKIPSNFAFDISPFWLGRKGGFTTADLNERRNFGKIFRQTFTISAAIRSADSADKRFNPSSTYAGLGFKFAIVRAGYSEKTQKALKNITMIQIAITFGLDSAKKRALKENKQYQVKIKRVNQLEQSLGPDIEQNEEYKALQKTVQETEKETINSILAGKASSAINQDDLDSLRKKASEFKIERIGFFCDIAGGSSLEFRNKSFGNSKLYNAGIWTTFGTTTRGGFSALGIIRYLYNPDQIYADPNNMQKRSDISTLDGGGRVAYSSPESRFLFSAEAIYRSVLNKNTVNPSWKLALNAEYDISKNQKLTFVFGRNFDGTITKDGNLIAALNLLTGFGNKR